MADAALSHAPQPNGATGVLLNSWTSGRRIFRVQMHAPRICVEAEHEGKGVLYADGRPIYEANDLRVGLFTSTDF